MPKYLKPGVYVRDLSGSMFDFNDVKDCILCEDFSFYEDFCFKCREKMENDENLKRRGRQLLKLKNI